eukprot:Hpha_TRINITY_DN2691_c0_g1::TRINITY_DN2691_c0_g1_i1::g.145909::m.145909
MLILRSMTTGVIGVVIVETVDTLQQQHHTNRATGVTLELCEVWLHKAKASQTRGHGDCTLIRVTSDETTQHINKASTYHVILTLGVPRGKLLRAAGSAVRVGVPDSTLVFLCAQSTFYYGLPLLVVRSLGGVKEWRENVTHAGEGKPTHVILVGYTS